MRRGGGPLHHASVPTSLGLAFPACVTEALLQVSKHIRLSSHGRGRPSLTKNNDLQLLIDNEIFCLAADRKTSRLSQLQEFTLINLLAHFFTERDEMNKYTYFEVLFLGREGDSHIHELRLGVLYRLASYALQFPVLQLYAQISLWLSKVGSSKPYAEELVAVLAEHYLKPADSKIFEFLLPLETSCPEFTVFFVVYATRFMPINRPMAAVFASYINRNPGYFLKGFRDSPHLADIFRQEVFEKMLTYLLELEGEPATDPEAMNYHTAVMVLLDKWSTTIKKPLDISKFSMPITFISNILWRYFWYWEEVLHCKACQQTCCCKSTESTTNRRSQARRRIARECIKVVHEVAEPRRAQPVSSSTESPEAREEVIKPIAHQITVEEAHEGTSPQVNKTAERTDVKTPEDAERENTTFKGPQSQQEAVDIPKKKVPEHVEYLLVGAGTAAYYASLAIRARHADAKVLMIGEEDYLPYNRPPLSKELWWYGDEKVASTLQYTSLAGKKRDIFFEADGFFVPCSELPSTAHGGVSLLKGRRVEKICPDEKKAYLDDKTCIKYDKCLIATGGRPKTLPELKSSPELEKRVVYLRGIEDYRRLESICKSSKSVTIVGGGFLGSELAYSIRRKYENVAVNQVIAESGNLSGVLPEHLSKKAADSLREIGVNVMTNTKIISARRKGDNVELEVNGSKKVTSEYVVVAIGIEPDVTVAKASGLEVDDRLGGIATDAELRVRTGIWAAGDAASFYDRSLGRRRIEHWENAQISGRLAGENMTGAGKAFWYQPSYFTKIAPKWHINAVGITDSSLPTVSVFAKDHDEKESYDRGVVFYKGADGKVVGVLLLNVFGSGVDVARRLIEEARSVEDFQQLAKLFSLYKPAETEESDKKS
ncbi:unnamed protein product [Cylicocyclus nassatus]|uniref:Uncharacterized protein n=1 Tax=Cylicocyclus nassatus TaxID=53992 RepID=A0AA36GU32_CYLNA|nr:unnamed protein product [Cylicocyclus nassatus]